MWSVSYYKFVSYKCLFVFILNKNYPEKNIEKIPIVYGAPLLLDFKMNKNDAAYIRESTVYNRTLKFKRLQWPNITDSYATIVFNFKTLQKWLTLATYRVCGNLCETTRRYETITIKIQNVCVASSKKYSIIVYSCIYDSLLPINCINEKCNYLIMQND